MEINEWYEENGFNSNILSLEEKMNLIKENFLKVDNLKNIEINRNIAVEKYLKELKNTHNEAKNILINKPWVEDHYNKSFLKEISEIENWYKESSEKQSKIKLYDVIIIFCY